MYCDCGKQLRSGYTAMPQPEKGPHAFNYDFWVCANCHCPSRMVWEKVTGRYSPARATSMRSLSGKADGTQVITWGTDVPGETIQTVVFFPYPRTKVNGMDQGRNHLLTIWQKLDHCVDQIKSGSIQAEYYKAQATAYADVIAQLMNMFYADVPAVSAEALARWTARQEGREHQSPGLAEFEWDPATRFDGTVYSRDNEAAVIAAKGSKPKVVFDEQKTTFIKHTLSNGQMTPEVLADMFNCTADDIKAVLDS